MTLVDPLGTVLSAVTGRLAARSLAAVLGPEGSAAAAPAVLDSDDGVYELRDEHDSPVGLLSAEQVRDIDLFLSRAEVRGVCESYLVLRMISASPMGTDHGAAIDIIEDIGRTFVRMARQWGENNRAKSWASLSEGIWSLISSELSSATTRVTTYLSNEHRNGADLGQGAIFATQLLRGSRKGADVYLRNLAEMFREQSRLTHAYDIAATICAAMRRRYAELSMTQVQDDHRFLDSQLYVKRTVVVIRNEGGHSSRSPHIAPVMVETLMAPSVRSRAVIIGNPGVGKSTLIGHLALQLASEAEATLTPVIVLCKEVGKSPSSDTSIIDHIVNRLGVEHSLAVTSSEVRDLLLLGNVCVIFDGVDEVLDQDSRRALIRRIESFSEEFPATSVLATSRRVGYEQARFNDDYQLYSLTEFDNEQFLEYVRRWFAAKGRREAERDAFVSESETVADIRTNPLMLSLLCGLYQARGYIPRNRRLIYRECADLLFTRWDASRQIAQPTDHRQHGTYLMHEIALFYFENQNAQSGIDETQLTGLIARFFENTAGLERDESLRRAKLFLEFCSGRAWLLSRLGTDTRGRRLYSFTHRTFMEYYAAEAFVRRGGGDVEAVVDRIERVFKTNASSIVPEVMVQAYDEREERGAEKVLRSLVDRGMGNQTGAVTDNYLTLCLRTVNVCAMSRAVTDLLPRMCLNFWEVNSVDSTRRSSTALFDLHRDARKKIIASFDAREFRQFEAEVLRRWARFELAGTAHQFDDGWAEELRPRIYATGDFGSGSLASIQKLRWIPHLQRQSGRAGVDQAIIDLWFLQRQIVPGDAIQDGLAPARPTWLTSVFNDALPGVALRVVISIIDDEAHLIDRWYCDLLRNFWNRVPKDMGHATAKMLLDVLYSEHVGWSLDWGSPKPGFASMVDEAKPMLLWLALLDYEINRRLAGMSHAIVSELVGVPIFEASVRGERGGAKRLEDSMSHYGAWASNWALGTRIVTDQRT